MKKLFLTFIFIGVGIYFVYPKIDRAEQSNVEKVSVNNLPKTVAIDVPFTSQAPLDGQWEDDRYQNACEEASILMAMAWVNSFTLTPEEASEEIAKLTQYQQDRYGEHRDRSAKDTAQLIQDYFQYDNVEYKTNIDTEDIIAELNKGNIVVAPFNGQKLNNPYYIPPGPIEHMAVIVGYAESTDEFIVNDPGTKRGKDFRYSASVVQNALQDYPTGYHLPITQVDKNMIIIRPK
jgi:hypothetical protein